MPWSLILNWRVVFAVLIALTLATSHWKVYIAGKNAVLAKVQADAMANEQAARAREQQLIAAKHKAEENHAAFKRRTQRAVAGAQSELDRLRDVLAARQATADAAPSDRTDGAATTERQLFGQCAKTLAGVAQQADQLAAQVIGLQGYVSAVCTAP